LIYIEIQNNFLFLSHLISKQNKFVLKNNIEINLDKLDFIDGILYNPSQIYTHVKSFLKPNNLKNPKAIICLPNLKNSHNLKDSNNLEQKLKSLQMALCLSKTGLIIETIISNSILKKEEAVMIPPFFYKSHIKNQLNFFKQFTPDDKTSPNKWLSNTIAMLLVIIISFFVLNLNKKTKLANLKSSNQQIEIKNQALKNKIKQMHLMQNQINNNKQVIDKIEKIKNVSNNPIQTLKFLSMSITPNSWIKTFNLDNKNRKLEINGTTPTEKSIPIILNKFSKLTNFKNLKIAKIEHVKSKKTKNFKSKEQKSKILYQFCLQGDL